MCSILIFLLAAGASVGWAMQGHGVSWRFILSHSGQPHTEPLVPRDKLRLELAELRGWNGLSDRSHDRVSLVTLKTPLGWQFPQWQPGWRETRMVFS